MNFAAEKLGTGQLGTERFFRHLFQDPAALLFGQRYQRIRTVTTVQLPIDARCRFRRNIPSQYVRIFSENILATLIEPPVSACRKISVCLRTIVLIIIQIKLNIFGIKTAGDASREMPAGAKIGAIETNVFQFRIKVAQSIDQQRHFILRRRCKGRNIFV